MTSIAFSVSQYTLTSSSPSNTVLPASLITKELPVGTGIFAASCDSVAVLLSYTVTVRLTELAVLFANVPPIRILFVADADVYDVVGPRKLTIDAVAAAVFVDALSN